MHAGVARERRPTGKEPRRSCALHRPADEHKHTKNLYKKGMIIYQKQLFSNYYLAE